MALDRDELLAAIAASRGADPLAPVTVICPSHLAALQMRRRLAELGPYAGVRFETLPRIAELIGAQRLAANGLTPLARPIGDHLAERVALESRPPLAPIRDLPGYWRALRRLFARLRRAGLRGGDPVPNGVKSPHLREVIRLYGRWREECAAFYDEEDLLRAAAAAIRDDPACATELGRLHMVPPGTRSADGESMLAALADARGGMGVCAEGAPGDEVRLILAPDRPSEAREAVREVLRALEGGVSLHQVAILHGADPAYGRPLREALEAAALPYTAMPGLPLVETPAGRGVLALLDIAREDLSRTAIIDALGVAPIRRDLPAGGDARARVRLGRWDRLSRAAGITHGIAGWRDGLDALRAEREEQIARAEREGRDGDWLRSDIAEAAELLAVVEALRARLDELVPEAPAAEFLERLGAIVADYLDPRAIGTAELLGEVARLGTVDAVGGTFSLARFASALRVNLEAASIREGRAGEGVLVADHRAAAGLSFDHVVLCGAAEGLLPAGPGADALVPDAAWAGLRESLPLIEDATLRVERSREAAARAVAAGRTVVLTCPLYEGAGAHEHYPSPTALAAAQRRDSTIASATALRDHGPTGWLSRPPSPLAAQLVGPAVDPWETGLRAAVARVRAAAPAPAGDPLERPLCMLRDRAGPGLTEWDGNLSAMAGSDWMRVPEVVSPTRLEHYGVCGFRFLMATLLRVRVPEEPRDPETIDPMVRGTLVHAILERFFREQQAVGRPGVGEAWTPADGQRALELLDDELATARRRGLAGLAVFSRQETRRLQADLLRFLGEDTRFRRETGAIPYAFEERMQAVGPGGQRFLGYIDRIDRSPADGAVWIVDYKTGPVPKPDRALGGGRLLQLPVYLLAAPAGARASALYWYISARGDFTQVPYDATPAAHAVFEGVVAAIGHGVRRGSFPAAPGEFNDHWGEFDNCGRCDFTRVCGRARGEDFERKAEHPGMAPWAQVAAAAALTTGEIP